MSHSAPPSRRLIVLGSTGSIGVSVMQVLEHLRARGLFNFEIAGLAAGTNAAALREQARRGSVRHVALADGEGVVLLDGIEHVHVGADAALRLIGAVARPGDLVVGAMVGVAGLPATLAAIERGCDIALANKETLVAAGALVMPIAQARGVNILPIDSEHSAIFQCLQEQVNKSTGQQVNKDTTDARSGNVDLLPCRLIDFSASVRRVVITASGGPFRTWSAERLRSATVNEALNHPTWTMGPKVTIDSASLMNKALEMIEAHWLFGLPAAKIEVIIHPQSLVHSFVEFVDGSTLAQLGAPDMKTPIQFALTWPWRLEGCARTMNWSELRRMDFEPLDEERFSAPRLARAVIARGGNAGAVLNAANEAAVQAFLREAIPFNRIVELVAEALEAIPAGPVHTMDDVLAADRAARAFVAARIAAAVPFKEHGTTDEHGYTRIKIG